MLTLFFLLHIPKAKLIISQLSFTTTGANQIISFLHRSHQSHSSHLSHQSHSSQPSQPSHSSQSSSFVASFLLYSIHKVSFRCTVSTIESRSFTFIFLIYTDLAAVPPHINILYFLSASR